MTVHPSVLCPIDLSEASRGALRIAGAISEHFRAELTVMTVEDPSIVSAAGTPDLQHVIEGKRRALEHFFRESFARMIPDVGQLRFEVLVGDAAPGDPEGGLVERCSDAIVMSSHGRTGVRKALFGSTTERVLEGTGIPVLVTPAAVPGSRGPSRT